MSVPSHLIEWALPSGVQCLVTQAAHHPASSSVSPFGDFNLALHVEDEPQGVHRNRQQLEAHTGLPIRYLEQVHGPDVIHAQHLYSGSRRQADGVYSDRIGQVCAVLTADCLPILLCDKQGEQVAALHGGWRSLVSGIIPKGLACFRGEIQNIQAYLGPAISQANFEVGQDVYDAFAAAASRRGFSYDIGLAFRDSAVRAGKYDADIYYLARCELQSLGVTQIDGGNACTFRDRSFYSYRREGRTGRFASLIWRRDLEHESAIGF